MMNRERVSLLYFCVGELLREEQWMLHRLTWSRKLKILLQILLLMLLKGGLKEA